MEIKKPTEVGEPLRMAGGEGEGGGYLPWGIPSTVQSEGVLSPARGDGGQGRTGFFIAAVWPLVGYGLGPGRRRFASNMPRICCAFAITSADW